MFTGLIERTGKVIALMPADPKREDSIHKLIVDPGASRYKTELGDSVAVNGCCLTVVSQRLGMLEFDVSKETMVKTSLSTLPPDALVNLERAMELGARLGGHMVAGHVDGVGRIKEVNREPSGWVVEVAIPRELGRYVISKGSICIDGVSLTVNKIEDLQDVTNVSVTLIPKTVEVTSFKNLASGRTVNIEVDLIGKYVERLNAPWLGHNTP
jgi:riboflavin synthase